LSEVKGNVTKTYTYDNAGNITSITTRTERQPLDPDPGFKPIIKAAGTVPTVITTTKTLSYSDSQWGDLLTSFDGHTITYDEIGNPLSYYNGTDYTFTWDGRRLVGAVSGSKTMSFAYNDEGIRTSKTVNGVTTTYYVNGGQIVAESNNSRTIVYIYNASGAPIGMMYRTPSYAANTWDTFWYEKNLQGDIIAIYNASGTKVATYTYTDAWGNFTVSYSNGGASTGAQYNPFRYRGYYYDADLGMYYLQSRYYDAKICRFISADGYVSTGQGILGNNMFAYCGNNPVMGYDPTGMWTITFSFGFDITFLIVGISRNISIAFDDDGNVVIQTSYSEPFFVNDGETLHIGLFDAGFGFALQYTEDDTVYDLEGPTTYVGTSAGTGLFYTGADMVFSGYNPIKEKTLKKPTGFQLTVGWGIGVDFHAKTTQTKTIYVIR
jgi:RHS repeat-associated protein